MLRQERIDNVRARVNEATKTEEQKEAEKSATEKISDAMPASAQETGSKLGGAIDFGCATSQGCLQYR